jgi:hypothetical protein
MARRCEHEGGGGGGGRKARAEGGGRDHRGMTAETARDLG